MELKHLKEVFGRARELTGHAHFVVIGSLSALGAAGSGPLPARLVMSIDVDCFTRDDPSRIFELRDPLGESSAFASEHGFYLDPVSPQLPTLPDGWRARLVSRDLGDGLFAHFLEMNDAAVSKYARLEPRDREWLRAAIGAGLVSTREVRRRFAATSFLDAAEALRAREALDQDEKAARVRGA